MFGGSLLQSLPDVQLLSSIMQPLTTPADFTVLLRFPSMLPFHQLAFERIHRLSALPEKTFEFKDRDTIITVGSRKIIYTVRLE